MGISLNQPSDSGEQWLAYPGQTPILDGGGSVPYAFQVYGAGISNVAFRWITFQNFTTNAINVTFSANVTINSNTFQNMPTTTDNGGAVAIFAGCTNCSVTHNLLQNLGGPAIMAPNVSTTETQSLIISYNIILNVNTSSINDAGAIHIQDFKHGSKGFNIFNNYINNYGHLTQHVCIYLDDEMSNVNVTGNICTGTGGIWNLTHGGDHNNFSNNVVDLTSLTGSMAGIGFVIYTSDGGNPDYGMAGNTYTHNLYYATSTPASTAMFFTGNLVSPDARPTVMQNTYYFLPTTIATSPFADTAPFYSNTVPNPILPVGWSSNVGRLPH